MSNGFYYNPIPPRAWTRVQNQCTTNQNNTNIKNDLVYIPLTKEYTTPLQAQNQEQMWQKGNILQYKNNSANFTKKQKYSQISRGCGSSRKKCYATQSLIYTNPNTSSFQRVNYTSVPIVNSIVGSPNNPSGPYQAITSNPFDCSSNILKDGGNLVCSAIVNPCTDEVIQFFKPPNFCFPSSCSDVPGSQIVLCWNPNIQTWIPRTRYTMPNSLNKWPEGYKGFVSAVTPTPPVLSITMNTYGNQASLSWTTNTNVCMPISSYNIYQNGVLINTVPYQITSADVYDLNSSSTYSFYVESVSGTILSSPSNIVTNE
jgi:hypothetical protein